MSNILTPQICYAAAIVGAFITALSQILLKTQANTTGEKGFFSKFLNIRVIVSGDTREELMEHMAQVRSMLSIEIQAPDGAVLAPIWE